jgi:hypothetical protein
VIAVALVVGGALAIFPAVVSAQAAPDVTAAAPVDGGAPADAAPVESTPAASTPPGEPATPAPPPAPATPAQPPAPPPAAPPSPKPPAKATTDELPNAGYVPGYRTYNGLSLSPYSPRVASLPGGLTPGFAAPMPPGQWSFRFAGFLSATFMASPASRRTPQEGQGGSVFHIPPQTVDEYASFVGTNTMPGQWVALNLAYGNGVVSANVSLNTWNPGEPTTYYQIGSQYFINNAYVQFDVPTQGKLRLRTLAGYFYNNYGALGQYGLGMYTNPLVAQVNGVGETTRAEIAVSPTMDLVFEHGFLGNRKSHVPQGVIPNSGNAMDNPIFASSWVNHVHAGFVLKGDPIVRGNVHWFTNFASDDRTANCATPPRGEPVDPTTCQDNPVTRQINEADPPDGHMNVIGFDGSVQDTTWGYLGVGGSYASAVNAYNIKGLFTFGGDGETLTNRWFGATTNGTGQLYTAGINYSASLGRILTRPAPFPGDSPDLVINAGFIIAYASTNPPTISGTTTPGTISPDVDIFNHRLRYKAALEGVYTFFSWMGAALRLDRVTPTSKDSEETFYVVAPRLIFKTGWNSRDNITLLYARWFYGAHTHPEQSSILPTDIGLDDQLIALNLNLWW